jgi:hypothetical protein
MMFVLDRETPVRGGTSSRIGVSIRQTCRIGAHFGAVFDLPGKGGVFNCRAGARGRAALGCVGVGQWGMKKQKKKKGGNGR